MTSNGPIHPGHRRQQYTLAELPFVCEFCPARYKTKPGLQYHLAKHKEANTDFRPSPSASSTADNSGSASPTSAMKPKYMNPTTDQPHQHPMYSHPPGPPGLHNNNHGGHIPPPGAVPPGMPGPPYPMNHPHQHPHPQHPPYGMPPQPHHHSMPPSASMPLTVAALSGSAPPSNVPYYPQQQHQMAHQQHMMMMQQQQQQQHHQHQHQQQQQQQHHHHQQQQQYQQPFKQTAPPPSSNEPPISVITGIQCDFCGGDEQENKTTKLPEQMITCKVSRLIVTIKSYVE